MRHFLKTINQVMFKPDKFYTGVQKQGLKEPMKFLVIFALLTQILVVYHYFHKGYDSIFQRLNIEVFSIPLTWQNFLLLYVGAVVWVIFYSFIRPAVSHMFVRIFNKNALYLNTYKTILYSNTPSYLVTPFYLVAVGLLFSMMFFHSTFLLILLIISVIFWLAGDVYGIYLKLLGFRKLHKLSIWKAVLCLYIFPMLFLIAIEVIVIFLVVLFMIF
jgi:hypothetical protein